MTSALRIGTRGSPLALWQANHVADLLRPLVSPWLVELVQVQTEGDRDQSASLAHIGGRGVFTKEIERALLDGRVDVAVHSLKDLPTQPVEGLCLGAVPPRGSTGDVLVANAVSHFEDSAGGRYGRHRQPAAAVPTSAPPAGLAIGRHSRECGNPSPEAQGWRLRWSGARSGRCGTARAGRRYHRDSGRRLDVAGRRAGGTGARMPIGRRRDPAAACKA